MSISTKVCIIGAGVAGLKTAHTLLSDPQSPFKSDDVVIVEAQDHIGGRIYTDSKSSKIGATYDLGASWFHDILTNSVLRDSIASGIFDPKLDGYFDDRSTVYFSSDVNGKIDVEELKLVQVVAEIEAFIEIHYANVETEDMLLREVVALYMDERNPFLSLEQKKFCSRMMRYLELWYGLDSDRISAKFSVMRHRGRNLFNKKGYASLIEYLANGAGCRILTDKPVKTIFRLTKDQPHHAIFTIDGTRICADYLVVAVPHSILALKEEHECGIKWQPPLPLQLQRSFDTIHFGALGKVVLEFDHIWWDVQEDRLVVLPDQQGKSNTRKIPDKDYVPKPFEYPIYIVNYARINPGKNSLVVLIQSPVTEYLEKNPALAWLYLRPMLQRLQVTGTQFADPINTIVTNWTQNTYIRGSYCALYVGDNPVDEIVQLSGEHDFCGLGSESTVRFAGEHTVSDGAGCVHGAYDSGERAARWILDNVTNTDH